MRQSSRREPCREIRGFTIIELVVVILILTILTLIALPRFSAMLYTQEENLAQSLLRAGMRTGRDTALRSGGEDDAAIAFFFSAGKTTMVPCVRVGVLRETVSGQTLERDVFVPVADQEPIQLPTGWSVRAYVPRGYTGDDSGWYETSRYDSDQGNWVFPETDFYDYGRADSGADRQTFIVRFAARTGEIVTAPSSPALVVSPRPTYVDRNSLPNTGCLAARGRLDIAADLSSVVRCILSDPSLNDNERSALMGDRSADTVLVRPVSQLAVYDERKLAAALGVQLDRDTRSVYRVISPSSPLQGVPGGVDGPEFLAGARGEDINAWIAGDTDLNGRVERADRGDAPEAALYALDRYSGAPRALEVQP